MVKHRSIWAGDFSQLHGKMIFGTCDEKEIFMKKGFSPRVAKLIQAGAVRIFWKVAAQFCAAKFQKEDHPPQA